MLTRIQQTVKTRRLLEPGCHVLVGVSGGADSVAMLYALHYLRRRLRLRLTVAHLNHQIRGKAAADDVRFVRRLAWRLGLPAVCGTRDVPRLAKRAGTSLEMAAREARRGFFREAARSAGADVVALAHTRDDHAETMLLRLARGAGPQGLGGIPHRGTIGGLPVIRPLRDVSHADAVRFLRSHALAWREDASNADPRFLRNRVRHEILPILEGRLNPQARRALARAGDLLREESDWVNEMADRLLEGARDRRTPSVLIVRELRRHPRPLCRRILIRWLAGQGVEPESVDADAIARVEGLLGASRGMRAVPLAGGWRVVRRYRELRLVRGGDAARPFRAALRVPGETILPEAGLRVLVEKGRGFTRVRPAAIGGLPARVSVSAPAVGRARLRLRSWKAGDRFRPLGLKGSRKIQDIFVDGKVAREDRGRVPLLECRGALVWVPGYRVARGWEVDGPAGSALHVLVERIET